jgi:diguanylate cyclase (GGDEF)-like protein
MLLNQPEGAMHRGYNGLQALCRFALAASGADLMVAFEADIKGSAIPLSSAPITISQTFQLPSAYLDALDWTDGMPRDIDDIRLPSAILSALGRPARRLLFIPTPVAGAPRSGIIMLWGANSPPECDCPFRRGIISSIPLLTDTFGQMLEGRRSARQQRLIQDRFSDLFETVPAAIVVLDGDGRTGLINERAAALLDVAAGRHESSALAMPMRELRRRCRNHEELDTTFQAVIGKVDYECKTLWDLGDRQFAVDTHPVHGDGQKGRIWLFSDVTAQQKVAADLRSLALSDALTGIANRRHFEESARIAIETARATGKPLALLMIDIDHFKSINDSYGHPAGDEVLKVVASRCSAALREDDLIARLGGEEFVVLLPATDAGEATMIAERLRAAIANGAISAGAAAIDVRASIGGSLLASSIDMLDMLLDRADAALYRAKREGRNRVMFESGDIGQA